MRIYIYTYTHTHIYIYIHICVCKPKLIKLKQTYLGALAVPNITIQGLRFGANLLQDGYYIYGYLLVDIMDIWIEKSCFDVTCPFFPGGILEGSNLFMDSLENYVELRSPPGASRI